MKNPRLEKLLTQKAQLENRIKLIQGKEQTQQRKIDTRRKILIGGTILALVRRGEWTEGQLMELLSKELTAQRDRELFGLAVQPKG